MTHDSVVEAVARAAAKQLVPDYGPRAEAEVEDAIYGTGTIRSPQQYTDPVAIGGLILAAAQFSYQIYSDRKKKEGKPSRDSFARVVRVEWRKEHDLTPGAEKVLEIISTEIVQRDENVE